MLTPVSLAACTDDLGVLGDLQDVLGDQLGAEAGPWPAADSSDLALAMLCARWAMLVSVDGNTGANGLSLPTSE